MTTQAISEPAIPVPDLPAVITTDDQYSVAVNSDTRSPITQLSVRTDNSLVVHTGEGRILTFPNTGTASTGNIIIPITVNNDVTGGMRFHTLENGETQTQYYVDCGSGTGIWVGSIGTTTSVSTWTTVNSNTNGQWIVYSNSSTVQLPPTPEQRALWARQGKQRERDRVGNIHRAKGAIKRALKLIDNIGFGDEVRIFIGGDEIEIEHPDSIFKFVLHRRANVDLIDKTIHGGYSTPYHLHLYTKTNVHVADLCVYLKDTPILDQVLAVALFIKSGEEEDILTKANWFNATKDENIRKLVHEYDPKYGRKLGIRLPHPEVTYGEADGTWVITPDQIHGTQIVSGTLPVFTG